MGNNNGKPVATPYEFQSPYIVHRELPVERDLFTDPPSIDYRECAGVGGAAEDGRSRDE